MMDHLRGLYLLLPVELFCDVTPKAFRVFNRPFVHGVILFPGLKRRVPVVLSNSFCATMNFLDSSLQTNKDSVKLICKKVSLGFQAMLCKRRSFKIDNS